MLGDVCKLHCNKCGKYLFTETHTETGIKRTDDNRDYRYDEITDEFICNDCDNEDYIEKIRAHKEAPVKIQWNERARGFYCPTCNTGTSMKAEKCNYCGQLLLPYLDI